MLALASWSYLLTWSASVRFEVLDRFYAGSFVGWMIGLTAAGMLVVLAIGVLDRRRSLDRRYAAGAMTVLLIQVWPVFQPIHERAAALGGSAASWTATLIVWGALLILTFRVSADHSLLAVFWVVATFLVAVPAFDAITFVATAPGLTHDRSAAGPIVTASGHSPDVYVVVTDAYSRSDVLHEDFGFDNDAFYRSLESHGLDIVPGATSNYSNTALSIASLIEADYPRTGTNLTREDRLVLQSIHSGDGALFDHFRSAGYETHLFENAWTFSGCAPPVEHCHSSSAWTELDYEISRRTPLQDLIPALRVNPWVRGSVRQLQNAATLASQPAPGPRFVFLHALIPHPPFHLTASCEEFAVPHLEGYVRITGVPGVADDLRKNAYVEQLRCANALLLDLVAAVPRDAAILITADHGATFRDAQPGLSETWTSHDLLGRFAILMAVRLPADCEPLDPDATIIDASARLMSCLTGRLERDIPRRHFVMTQSDDGQRLLEATDVMAGTTR